MSKFIKLKVQGGARVLVAASKVEYASEQDQGTLLSLDSGEELLVQESYQTVVNRLTKGDDAAAE